MTLIFQALPFLIVFYLLYFYKGNAIYYFLPINIYFDVIVGFFPENGSFGILRAIVLGLLILPQNILINQRIAYIIYLLLCYWLILVFFSSDISYSFKVYLQVFFTLIFFPIGYSLSKNDFNFSHFSQSILVAAVLLISNFIIANYFGIGENPYSEDLIYSGNLQTTSLYIITYVVLAFPFLINTLKSKKMLYLYGIIVFSLVMVLLLFGRRSPVFAIILGLGVLFLFYYRRNLKKIIMPAIGGIFILLILSMVFFDKINATFSARESRFEDSFYENELRYIETQLIWLEYGAFGNPMESFFGKEIFNTVGNYGKGAFGDRPIHVDYNRVLHGSGFVGLSIYLFLLITLIISAIKRFQMATYANLTSSIFPSQLIASYCIMLVAIMGFFSFSGGISGVTFRSYGFFMIGFSLSIPFLSKAES